MPKKKVLIVDDEKDIVNFLEKFLCQFDITPVILEPGEEVVDAYAKHAPDCIFLDIQMPGKDGLAILKELQRCRPVPKVIMITGRDEKEFQDNARRNGAVGYITKPLDIMDLRKAVQAHIVST